MQPKNGPRNTQTSWSKSVSDKELRPRASFHHPEKNIRTYVHGDDYVSTGKPSQFRWVREQFESRYIVKTQVLGPNKGEQKQIKVFNRILTWKDDNGIDYEADPKHVEIIFKQLQFIEAKVATTPGTKDESSTSEDHNMPLGDKDATSYRAIVAGCNYLALDRPDIALVVNELARAMAKPTRGDQQ